MSAPGFEKWRSKQKEKKNQTKQTFSLATASKDRSLGLKRKKLAPAKQASSASLLEMVATFNRVF